MTSPRPKVDQPRQKNNGTQVLVWMRDEFEALRRQVHALATSVAQQRSLLSDLTDGRVSEMNVSLAELESCAASLRHEASKLQGLEKAMAERLTGIVADAVRPQLRAAVAARLPGLVSETVQPELKVALAEVRECADDLKDEYSRLRAMRDELTTQIPDLVQAAVERALESQHGAGAAASPGHEPALTEPPVPETPAVAPPVAPSPASPAPATASTSPSPADMGMEASDPSGGSTGGPFSAAASPSSPFSTSSATSTSRPVESGSVQTLVGSEDASVDQSAAGSGASSDTHTDPMTANGTAPAAEVVEPAPPAEAAEVVEATEVVEVVEDDVTCVMPGMVVGPSLAAGITAALGRARLRRRRRRRAAAPAPGLHRRDPFAGHVTRRLERFTRGRASTPGVRPAQSEGRMGEGTWAVVAAGARDAQEVTVDLARMNGLVLAGTGSANTARALVTTLLASRAHTEAAAIVVGDLLPAVPPFPGLAQAHELGPVIDELTAEVTRRSKLLAEEGVPDAGAYRSRHPEIPLPLLLLATSDPPAEDADRLGLLLTEGARVGVNAVFASGAHGGAGTADALAGATHLALEPDGRVSVAAGDGPVTTVDGAVAFSLDTQTAAELLAVLASARTDGEHMRPVVDDNQAFRPSPPNPEAKVRVDLMGPYRIEVGGAEIRSGLRAKARELLAFYLLHPEGATLDEATEALWPEADPRRGSEWFWTALGNLRTRVRQATGQKELKVIDRDGDLYRVEDIFDVDLWRLERALYEGVHGPDDEARVTAFGEAAVAYTGELLAGIDWFWLETPREDLRERVVDVLVWLGDRRWASADVPGAAQALNQALDVDPFAEQVYRRVIRLQARISRPEEADGAYRTLKARLAEIGLEPTAETEKLYSELRASR